MNKLGLMTLGGFIISLMMIISCFAAGSGNPYPSSGSAGTTGGPGINNPFDEGMSSSGWDYEFGLAPEYGGENFNTPYRGEMSSGEKGYDRSPYELSPDKVPNSPY